ncbi:MAG: Crp/Fnr family transcriptional regulator, partial [Bacteroidota bacterium]
MAKISFLRQFNRGEYIFTPGNTADWIGFITSGVAREYATDPRGQEEVWDLLCEGDYCTLAQPFFEKAPSICGIQALEDMELVVVTRKDLFWLFESIPELQAFTYELLSNRMLERMQQRSRLLNMTAL